MEPLLGQIGSLMEKFGVPLKDPSIYSTYDDITNGLQELGLTPKEARILLYLIIRKNSTATDISSYNDIGRTEIYNYLTNLMKKGVVFSSFDRPQRYFSLTLDKAMDHLIEAKRSALQHLSDSRAAFQHVLDKISSAISVPQTEEKESYQVLYGENSLISAVKRMIPEAKAELLMLLGEKSFVGMYHAGVVDELAQLANKGVKVSLKTSCRNVEEYIDPAKYSGNLSVTTVPSDTEADFVLVDNKDIVVLPSDKSKPSGFYTNNTPMISVFKAFFEKAR